MLVDGGYDWGMSMNSTWEKVRAAGSAAPARTAAGLLSMLMQSAKKHEKADDETFPEPDWWEQVAHAAAVVTEQQACVFLMFLGFAHLPLFYSHIT